jgi:hypothetical protein
MDSNYLDHLLHPTNNIFSGGGRTELLGSFVGSDEFIRNSVKNKTLEISNLADTYTY